METNKVIYCGETIIDLTNDTVTPETLAEGETAHAANGALIVGAAKKVNIVQGKGESATNIMSQKAVSDLLNAQSEEIADLNENKQPVGDYALRSEIPNIPVQSVNGKTGTVVLNASDVGATTQSYVDNEIADLKAQGIQQVPLFANSIEECIDTTKMYVLPDGYIYAYMETSIEGGQPLFANLAKPTSGAWMNNYRFSSSSGSNSACTGAIVSNPITAKKGDVIRVKGLQNGTTTATSSAYFALMGYSDEGGATKVFSAPTCFDKTKAQHVNGVKDIVTVVDGVTTHTLFEMVANDGSSLQRPDADKVVTIRVSGEPVTTVDDIIITINEEIKYSESSTGLAWVNTGRAFVPSDYEDRIIGLENTTATHSTKIATLEKVVKNGSIDETLSAALAKIRTWDKPVYDSSPVTLIDDNRLKPALTSDDKTVNAIYSKYRALMAQYPKLISETNLGLSTASATFSAVDMLRFDIKEPDGMTDLDFNPAKVHETKPKIIFMSGVHKEWAGVYGLYYAIEEIITNPEFDDIRRNAHIIVIPCANPFGLTPQTAIDGWQMSHVNANGVAIHNNFGVDHSTNVTTVGAYNYGGTAPYSELETQYIDAVMAENSDAIAFVSCHNNDYSTYFEAPVIWASPATYHMCNVAFRLCDKLTKAWLNKYGQTLYDAIDAYKINMDADDYRLGRAVMSSSYGTEQKNATKYGIQGLNLETSRLMKIFSGNEDCSAQVMTRSAEIYANFMRTLLACYDHNDKKDYAPNLPWEE